VGGGRGEKAGSARACCARRWSSTWRSGTLTEIAITKHRVRTMASGKAAAPGDNAASSSAARHRKTTNRRMCGVAPILFLSYARRPPDEIPTRIPLTIVSNTHLVLDSELNSCYHSMCSPKSVRIILRPTLPRAAPSTRAHPRPLVLDLINPRNPCIFNRFRSPRAYIPRKSFAQNILRTRYRGCTPHRFRPEPGIRTNCAQIIAKTPLQAICSQLVAKECATH
jgi:hypothetical protein